MTERIYGNLYSCMKTTVELPDELMIEVKTAAAVRRTTIREIVERALRRELLDPQPNTSGRSPIRWVTVDGGLPPGADVSDRQRLRDWIDSERRP